MFTSELILRLRARCPSFSRRVGGTASFEQGTTMGVQLPVPHCFVIPVEEVAQDARGNETAQRVRMTFLTVVCVDNTSQPEDGRGLTGSMQVESIRRELLNALIGWEPFTWSIPVPENMKGFEDIMPRGRSDTVRFRGGSFLKMNDGKLWHQFEWSIDFMDGRCISVELERHTATVTLSDYAAVVVDQSHMTASTAVVTGVMVTGPDGYRLPTTEWTFDASTGVLTALPIGDNPIAPDAELSVMFEMETPRYGEIARTIYTEYYPSVLAQAGGDPNAITDEMYRLLGEFPIDATVTWEPTTDPVTQPTFSGGTPTNEPDLPIPEGAERIGS